jgi:hypothetical protein
MKVNIVDGRFIFEGVMDEGFSPSALEQALQAALEGRLAPPFALDFSQVSRANSNGILIFLRFLAKAEHQFKYVNAPEWLVNQFNLISGYFVNNSYVESLFAPYFSAKNGKYIQKLLVIGKDIPLLEDYSKMALPELEIDGLNFEIDFYPEQYFQFISENLESFLKSFKS